MPRITLDDGVIDISSLVYGSAVAIMALAALIGIFTLKRRKASTLQKRENALKALEFSILGYYHRTQTHTDSAHFIAWRKDYINLAEKKYGPDVWIVCVERGAIPPLDLNTGELISA